MPLSMRSDREFLFDYFDRLCRSTQLDDDLMAKIIATRDMWIGTRDAGAKVIFIGNGGSAATASHLAIDLAKNGGVLATCFNEASMITCLANDYGYDSWMRHAVRIHGRPQDTLAAISSSGRSRSILNAVEQARDIGLNVVTLSGMSPDNPLRSMGDVNFWVDSRAYNIVETVHQFLLLSVVDLIIGKAEYPPN